MTYTVFDTKQQAIAANMAEAQARNCDIESTKEWWLRVDHPLDGRSALENGGPTTKEQLTADGWFNFNEEI